MEAPRINASMLPKYSGKIVCLVGNVTEISSNGAELKLMACDQKIVNVTLDAPVEQHFHMNGVAQGLVLTQRWPIELDEQLQGAVEIIGRVERNCSLSGQRIIPYNNDFDLELYGEAVSMTTDFPEIFGSVQSNGFGY